MSEPPAFASLPKAPNRGREERDARARAETGDRAGPAVGYNQEPEREEDEGVS